MTIVSKASAYPKSVQSGLPRLGTCPPGWTRGPLSAHLIEELRPLNMAEDEVYDLVTVKRSRGGVILRERLKGSEIAVKSQFRVKAGDFLISKRQIVHGACGIVPPELDGAIVSNEYSVLRARPTLELNFLNCLAHSIYFQQTCFHSSIGVHVEKMIFKLDEWMKWNFDLPPLREQRRIVEIFHNLDRAIETVDSLVKCNRSLKEALVQKLLSKGGSEHGKRLPGFSGEWRESSFGELFDLKIGGTPSRANPSLWDGGRTTQNRWVAISDLQTKYIDETRERISDEGVRKSNVKVLPAGTIVMSFKLSIGRKAILRREAYTNEAICALIPKRPTELNSLFVYHALDLVDFTGSTDQAVKGQTLNKAKIAELKMRVPTRAEQDRLVAILEAADGETENLLSQLFIYRREKAALLQRLLTGASRVRSAECEAA